MRLPIYRPLSVAQFDCSTAPVLEASSRDYPCPECGERAVTHEYVAIVRTTAEADSRAPDEYVHPSLASALADKIMRGGFISFKRGEPDQFYSTVLYAASVGVVSAKTVANIEQRATERGMQIAEDVADEACKQIKNWGSYYGKSWIDKQEAFDFIREAVKRVSSKWREANAN